MRILLPVDGSATSLHAVEWLVLHAADWREKPEIHLLHVHPPIPIGRVQAHVGHDTLLQFYREEAEAEMRSAEQALTAASLAYIPHIHVGAPAEVIARVAAEIACDLLLMGSHGRGATGNFLLGSVATRVIQLAHCPVQLVK